MLNNAIKFVTKQQFIPVDEWEPNPEDIIFKHMKSAITIPLSSMLYNTINNRFDSFIVSTKRCYDKPEMRQHTTKYLNYFEKFYDNDRELIMIYANIKYLIDYVQAYDEDAFMYDICRYILSPSILYKVTLMDRDNYKLNLSNSYKNKNNVSLQYTDKHGHVLMKISVLMNIVIPLVTHFIYEKDVQDTNGLLLKVYDKIIHLDIFDCDIHSKIYETTLDYIENQRKIHPLINTQDIRGINITLHVMSSVENLLLNVVPKYEYIKNPVVFNHVAIKKNMGYKITEIGYEFDYRNLSSSKRDQENNSEFDKFENTLTKENEALFIQNKVNCEETMSMLNLLFRIDEGEVNFYLKHLTDDNEFTINPFQKELVFNLFYKYFGDVVSIKAINRDDYIRLIIMAKRILMSHNMVILPYIIGGKVVKVSPRRNINKKESNRLEKSEYYTKIMDKYKNTKMEKIILSLISTMIASEFQIIDYYDMDLHGKYIEVISEIICEEVMLYVSLI